MTDIRIAVPSMGEEGLEGLRSAHFGHCDSFVLVDIKNGKIDSVELLPNVEHSEGGCLVPVRLLAGHNVTAIIVSGMGLRPLAGFQNEGINVYYDGENARVSEAVEAFMAGTLTLMKPEHTCGGH